MGLPFSIVEDGYFDLTPELAKRLLATARPNRNVRQQKVEYLKRQIALDRYRESARFLGFNEDDQLVDGSHLCTAVSEGEKTIKARAARIRQSDVLAVDTGASRTAADLVQLRGLENAPTLVGSLRLIRSIEACEGRKKLTTDAGGSLSNEEIWEQIQEDPSLIESVAQAREYHKMVPFLSASHVSALHHMFRIRGGDDRAQAFWEEFTDPKDEASVLAKMRKQLLQANAAQRKPPRMELVARLAEVWNRWLASKTTGGVPYPRKFPVIAPMRVRTLVRPQGDDATVGTDEGDDRVEAPEDAQAVVAASVEEGVVVPA